MSDKTTKTDAELLEWIYDRMVNVHDENPNCDYMLKFKLFNTYLKAQEEHSEKLCHTIDVKSQLYLDEIGL